MTKKVDYDDCLDSLQNSPNKLTTLLSNSDKLKKQQLKKLKNEDEWKKHWVGMPEFEQEEKPPYKKIIINFRTKEDYEEFAKLIGQELTEKSKSIWHPKLEKDQNTLKRWIESE